MAKARSKKIQEEEDDDDDDDFEYESPKAIPLKSVTPVLDHFSIAIENLIAADVEENIRYFNNSANINDFKKLLMRDEKRSIIILGEDGVGKETCLKSLSLEIKKNNVPIKLQKLQIRILNLDNLVAGTKYRGQLEDRIKAISTEIQKNDNIVLFLNSIGNLLTRNDETASYLFYSIYAMSEIRNSKIILCLTPAEKEGLDSKNLYFFKNFNIFNIYQPNKNETLEILRMHLPRFLKKYSCSFNEKNLNIIVELTDLFIDSDFQPLKSIDLLEETFISVDLKRYSNPDDEVLFPKFEELNQIQEQIEIIIIEKNDVIKNQKFEEAAGLRDKEKNLKQVYEAKSQEIEKIKMANKIEININDIELALSKQRGINIEKIQKREKVFTEKLYSNYQTNNGLSQYEITQTQSLLNEFEIKIRKGSCFVLIPHNTDFDSIYEYCIRPILQDLGISVMKASDIPQPGNILSQIWQHIRTSEIIIADISDNNTNVIFELGLCYGIKRCPILISRDIEQIPFNLRSLRHIEYENNAKGIEDLKRKLKIMVEDFISITRASLFE